MLALKQCFSRFRGVKTVRSLAPLERSRPDELRICAKVLCFVPILVLRVVESVCVLFPYGGDMCATSIEVSYTFLLVGSISYGSISYDTYPE